MAKRLQIRRDTAEAWASVNPVLLEGELGLVVSGGKIAAFKVGNGVSAWGGLPLYEMVRDGALDALDESIGAIASAIAENTAAIAANSADISANTTALDGKADNATTLAGYGITNAYTKSDVDNLIKAIGNAYNEVSEAVKAYYAEYTEHANTQVGEFQEVHGKIAANTIAIDELAPVVNGHASAIAANAEAIEGYRGEIDAIDGRVEYLELEAEELKGYAVNNTKIREEMQSELTLTKAAVELLNLTKANASDVTELLKEYAKVGDVPTKVSELSNDAGYITFADVPSVEGYLKVGAVLGTGLDWQGNLLRVIPEISDGAKHGATAYGWGDHRAAGYLTQSSLSGYAKSSDLDSYLKKTSLSFGTGLNNDNFSVAVDTDVIATRTWVEGKKYLTSVSKAQVTTALGFTPQQEISAGDGIAFSSNVVSVDSTIARTSALSGYATQSWVEGKKYLTSYTEKYTGTVTGVKINGTTKNPSSGIVDLGTVITAHQSLSNYVQTGSTPYFAGVNVTSGANLNLMSTTNLSDPGDIVFLDKNETEIARIWTDSDSLGAIGLRTRFGSSDSAKVILHSGNIGNYISGRSRGLASCFGTIADGDMNSRPTSANTIWIDKTLRYYLATNSMSEGKPIADGFILHSAWDNTGWNAQLYLPNAEGSNLQFRAMKAGAGLTWGDWKTIAFTDSTVAAANKLQTARTIWGQSFDGSGNVSGDLVLGQNKITGSDQVDILNSVGGWVILGNGVAKKGWPTYVDGNAIYLRYGTGITTGLILNSSGNVTIGSSDLAGTVAKLYVDGYVRAKSISIIGDGNSLFLNRGGEGIYVHPNGISLHDSNNQYVANCISFHSNGNTTIHNNVGIGTNAPVRNLHINDTSGIPALLQSNQPTTALGFSQKDGGTGYIVYNGGEIWKVTNNNWSKEYRIIHSGNISDYALVQDDYDDLKAMIDASTHTLYNLQLFQIDANQRLSILETTTSKSIVLGGLTLTLGSNVSAATFKSELGIKDYDLSGYATQTWVNNKGYAVLGSDASFKSVSFGASVIEESSSDLALEISTRIRVENGVETNKIICKSNNNIAVAMGSIAIGSGVGDGYSFYADSSSYVYLGAENHSWYGVYAYSFNNVSDATKKNVLGNVELKVSDIANAPAKVFTWKDLPDKRRKVGTIAQYWQNVLPEVVSGSEGNMSMNYAELAVVSSIVIARSVETHAQRIDRLEREITNLQNELDELRKNSE